MQRFFVWVVVACAGLACSGNVESIAEDPDGARAAAIAASLAEAACGDGSVDAGEQCDDGNRTPYDGCSPTCTVEPRCESGPCAAVCGDGVQTAAEACDDGNTRSDDGCSAQCTIEPGWTCSAVKQPPSSSLTVPVLYRDMLYSQTAVLGVRGSPDFESFNAGLASGLVRTTLGADGKPVFQSRTGSLLVPSLSDAVNFCWWYHTTGCNGVGSINPFARSVVLDASGNPTSLTLTAIASNVYRYTNTTFFPVDGLGWNARSLPQVSDGHNFSFTSELHYVFTYDASAAPTLTFVGDDDAWVYINGRLAVDLGGVHSAVTGSVTLNRPTAAALGLVDGGAYSIDVFHAERHTSASNYQLTLAGFTHTISVCGATCGDGIVSGDEVCDDGVNDGAYGGCLPDCSRQALHCGDGEVNGPEQCDEGPANGTGYGHCTAACMFGPRCGDGEVNGPEQCDNAINDGSRGTCNPDCTLAERCGDGEVNGPEQCDLGASNGSAGGACTAACAVAPGWVCDGNVCRPTTCGDGIVEGSEQCDDGNRIPYDGCSPVCAVEPRCAGGSCTATCGDGVKSPSEACDDGNLQDGDGCSAPCAIETGWSCTAAIQAPAPTLTIPVLYRDMLYRGTTVPGPGNPDFENFNGGLSRGMVQSTLGPDNEPVFQSSSGSLGQPQLTNATTFCWWFHQTGCAGAGSQNPLGRLVFLDLSGNPTTLQLVQTSPNVYLYSNTSFFPVDGLGWNATTSLPQVTNGHNFAFTSELHYVFTYNASAAPTLTFAGDDDVWVFINGHLAVDLGGVHSPTSGSVTLNSAAAATLGLIDGGAYSIDVFQAERHTTGSNYQLTLAGFTRVVSSCARAQ